MIKISKQYIPYNAYIIKEFIRNSVINTVIINLDSHEVFVNNYKHTQLYYNQDINEYANIIMDRIHNNKIKNI